MRDGKATGKKEICRNVLAILFPVAIAALIGMVSIRIWDINFNNQMTLAYNDEILGSILSKSLKEYGLKGVLINYRMGAPECSALLDCPFLDWAYVLVMYFFTLITPTYVMAYFAFYIFTFASVAFTMFLLVRRLTKSYWLQVFLSVAYAITPYHFTRYTVHMTLSNYYMVPIVIYLALLMVEEDFSKGIPLRYSGSFRKKLLLYLAAVVVGMSNIYYVLFALIVLLFALLWKGITLKSIKVLWNEARVLYAVMASCLMCLAPKILYGFLHGANEAVNLRQARDVEIFALKIIQMLLPVCYGRVKLFTDIYNAYSSTAINVGENANACLGWLGSIGFLIACVWLIVHFVNPGEKSRFALRMSFLSFCILILVLYATGGGFGTIVSYVITPQLRSVNRVSIFIAGLSLLCLGLCLNWLFARIGNKWGAVLCLAAFLFTLYAEVPIRSYSSQEREDADAVYTEFFSEIEDDLEPGDMVYVLPYTDFPEYPPVYAMQDYEAGYGYLYTDTIRWSYGGVKGRNDSAAKLNVNGGMSVKFLKKLVKKGFSGVYIDTDGFEDGGAAINAFYQEDMGLTPLISGDGKLYFYNISELSEEGLSQLAFNGVVNAIARRYALAPETADELGDRISQKDPQAAVILYEALPEEIKQLPDSDFIDEIYRCLLGREPDEAGKNANLERLGNGDSREQIVTAIVDSKEFWKRCG